MYLSLGKKLTKIHKILKFGQSDWLKNTSIVTLKKEKMELKVLKKTLLKLMINSAHSKTTENLGESINVRPVNNEKGRLKYVNKPTFTSQKIFDKNFEAIHERKPVLTLNRPIYVAFTVLKLTKWLMYDFHYNLIKKN